MGLEGGVAKCWYLRVWLWAHNYQRDRSTDTHYLPAPVTTSTSLTLGKGSAMPYPPRYLSKMFKVSCYCPRPSGLAQCTHPSQYRPTDEREMYQHGRERSSNGGEDFSGTSQGEMDGPYESEIASFACFSVGGRSFITG